MDKVKYEVTSLDVWGNAEDGYEVNAEYSTGRSVFLSPDASHEEIIQALQEGDMLNKDFPPSAFGTEDQGEDQIMVLSEINAGYPMYNLTRVAESQIMSVEIDGYRFVKQTGGAIVNIYFGGFEVDVFTHYGIGDDMELFRAACEEHIDYDPNK